MTTLQRVPRGPRNTPPNNPFPSPDGTPRNTPPTAGTFARPDAPNPVPHTGTEHDGTASRAVVPSGGVPTKWNTRNGGARNNRRTARETECPTCGQPVLAGLDADRMAREAVINPTPITPAIELTEWAAGRPTYTYSPLRGEIDYRDHGSLTPRPDVHATHTCPKEDPLW